MKKVLSTVLLMSLTMTVISCNDNEREVTTFETEVNNLNKLEILQGFINAKGPVSYTHLTLPTNREV